MKEQEAEGGEAKGALAGGERRCARAQKKTARWRRRKAGADLNRSFCFSCARKLDELIKRMTASHTTHRQRVIAVCITCVGRGSLFFVSAGGQTGVLNSGERKGSQSPKREKKARVRVRPEAKKEETAIQSQQCSREKLQSSRPAKNKEHVQFRNLLRSQNSAVHKNTQQYKKARALANRTLVK